MVRLFIQSFLGLCTAVILAVSCQPLGQDSSQIQSDDVVRGILQISKLSVAHQRDVCLRHPMIVFVGNADEIVVTSVAGSIPSSPTKPPPVTLDDLVKLQAGIMPGSLLDTMCDDVIAAAVADGMKAPEALFLAITDGPGETDSHIETTHYTWNPGGKRWAITAKQSWQPSAGSFSPSTGVAFELHLPTQVEDTIRSFKNIFYGLGLDEMIYTTKSHGMEFASAAFSNDLVGIMSRTLPEGVKLNHSFLFDPHGPELGKEYSAGLFLPYWMPTDGCVALSVDSRITPDFMNSHRGFCTCKDILLAAKRPLKNFATCNEPVFDDDDIFNPFSTSALGSAKSTMFRSYDAAPSWPVTTIAPNGVTQFASAVSYDMSEPKVPGISEWQLPYGAYPTLILLDSCRGSPDVANLIERHDTARSPRDRIVTLTSSNLVSDNITTYAALTLHQYVLLAQLPTWVDEASLEEDRSIVQKMHDDLIYHLNSEGLVDLDWVAKRVDAIRAEGGVPDIDLLKRQSLENDNAYRYFQLNVR